MSFIIRNKIATDVLVDDLGITILSGADYDMLTEPAGDVQTSGLSGGDLNARITAGDLVVVDPRDGVTELSAADSIKVIQLHNNPMWGINGGRLNDIDDVDLTGSSPNDVLQLNGTGNFVPVSPGALAGNINFGDLGDITDAAGHVSGSFYILQGDGTNLISVDGATDTTVFIPFIEDTAGNAVAGGVQSDITLTYNATTNKIDASVDDVFLRNTGDTLDSGTLTVASGATILASTGAVISMVDAPTSGIHLANKDYVDSIASGLDAKNSCYVATTPGLNLLNYNATGGASGNGQFTNIDVTAIDGFPGTPTIGQRILVKDQTDPKQNGIYVISALAGSPLIGTSSTLDRADDFDGSPNGGEVSGGAFTFVEAGTINADTGWVVTDNGTLVINTDPINWSQFSGAGSYSAGAGLGLNGTQFYLDVNNLNTISIDPTDEIAFNDVTDTTTKKATFNDMVTALNLYTGANLTASDGVLITAGDIQLDITNLTAIATPSLSNEFAIDAGGVGSHSKLTIGSMLNGLDIPYSITTNGFVVRTANDTYTSRNIAISAVAGQNGLSILDGDGVAGNPTIGLDIVGTASSTINLTSTDEFVAYNGTTNVSLTGQQIADGVAAILGGLGSAYTIIQGDTGSATASSSTDTLAFIGAVNGGITTVATDSAPDNVTFALTLSTLASSATTIQLTDVIAIDNGTSTLKFTLNSLVTDLGIPNGVGSSTGILVSDGTGNYSAVSIAVQGVGDKDGLEVINGNGVAGNPTVGLDIIGTPAAGENLAATDELIVYNSSNTANQKFTGQEVADGVATILGFGGLSVAVINGESTLVMADPSRGNKLLSTSDISITWSENRLGNNDWLEIGRAVDALSGYVVPMNATIVKITGHTANNKGNVKPIILYIDGTLNSTVGTFNGAAGEDKFLDTTLNIDVNQNQKIRLRAGTGGKIEDTVVTIWMKWRA